MRASEPLGLFAVCLFSQAGLGRGFDLYVRGWGVLRASIVLPPLRGRCLRKQSPGLGAGLCIMQDAPHAHLEVERHDAFMDILMRGLGRGRTN